MKPLPGLLSSIALLLLSLTVIAQSNNQPYRQFGEDKVFFSAFNSNFIQPDIASLYNISRGKDKGLVNIAVVNDKLGGQTALVTGTVTNIFAQQQSLDFFEVREGDSVYYLAPFEFDNEDSLTFKIQAVPAGGKSSYSLKFQRKFYYD